MKAYIRIIRKFVGFALKNKLESFVDFYLATVGFSLAYKGWCATRLTSTASIAVIDGYPRSANSFATKAFMAAQGGFVRVGNHVHSPANIIRGIRLGKPALVVIREPRDAILGYCAWSDQTEGDLPDVLMRCQLRLFVKRYIAFYSKLLPYIDQLVVAEFTEVTSDFGALISRLNEKFGTNFDKFEHTAESQQKLFDEAPSHLSPSESRDNIKSRYSKLWEEMKDDRLVTRCYQLYSQLT